MVLTIVAVVLISGAFIVMSNNDEPASADTAGNVQIVDGQQVIALTAKGGFSPAKSTAAAGMSSVLRVSTNGTFDCSSSINIPSIGYMGNLPSSGATDIAILPQPVGTVLNGTCSMGMYNFTITFI